MMPILVKEVEERPRLVTAGYGRHRGQWVKEQASNSTEKPAIIVNKT